MPACVQTGINMAIHPDDPAWSVFGLPRIITNQKNISRMMAMVDNPHNGVTFCSGSYGTNPENNLPEMIRSLKGRIHFAHVRNLKFKSQDDFEEAAHLSSDGDFDIKLTDDGTMIFSNKASGMTSVEVTVSFSMVTSTSSMIEPLISPFATVK